jgi:hypothetical protein
VDSVGIKRSDYLKESSVEGSYHNYMQGTSDLLGLGDGISGGNSETGTIDDLLGL